MFVDTLAQLDIHVQPLSSLDHDFPIWMVAAPRGVELETLGWLNAQERYRASRFVTNELRSRYIATHLALRALLADAYGLAVERQDYCFDPGMKPSLKSFRGPHWSLSYSGEIAIIGISNSGPIGVDLERRRYIADAQQLAQDHFTASERNLIADEVASRSAPSSTFLSVWVRKEACIKATGVGLSLPLTQVDCGGGYETKEVRIGDRLLRTSATSCLPDYLLGWALCT